MNLALYSVRGEKWGAKWPCYVISTRTTKRKSSEKFVGSQIDFSSVQLTWVWARRERLICVVFVFLGLFK